MRNKRRGFEDESLEAIASGVLKLQSEIEALPGLSAPERAKLDTDIAIDHLYYSSKIEGTNLTKEGIDNAIYDGEEGSAQG